MISELNRSHPGFPDERWLGNWLKNGPRLDKTIDLLMSFPLSTSNESVSTPTGSEPLSKNNTQHEHFLSVDEVHG